MFPRLQLLSAVIAASSLVTGAHAAACSCGYKVAAHGNAYFRQSLVADFTTAKLSGTATSASWLNDYGFHIADGYKGGGTSSAPDHTDPIAHFGNVRIQNGALELVVPGGQKITNGGKTTGAQIEGPSNMIGGVFTMTAKIDKTPGTDQSMVRGRCGVCGGKLTCVQFTYHGQATNTQDEQDMEILGSYLYQKGDNGTPAGIELTVSGRMHSAKCPGLIGLRAELGPDGRRKLTPRLQDRPVPVRPCGRVPQLHVRSPACLSCANVLMRRRIAWLSDKTTYYMDTTALDSPPQYRSTNPSALVINHWTNGDRSFCLAPSLCGEGLTSVQPNSLRARQPRTPSCRVSRQPL
jgi:hypothetical protein